VRETRWLAADLFKPGALAHAKGVLSLKLQTLTLARSRQRA